MALIKHTLCSLAFLCATLPAQAAIDFTDWPMADDAREFARLDDKLPAILSYFSQHSQAELAQLYRQAFGSPAQEASRYGQLELLFIQPSERIRVVISSQQQWQQVDVMVLPPEH
ncbi:MAG: hypothetical protein LAT66_02275 [Alkalimonas sp.]|nr:hypothetical protein [Alkalimonas sp.]